MTTNLNEVISILLVGMLWGCTNPFIRKGSLSSKDPRVITDNSFRHKDSTFGSITNFVIQQLLKFRSIHVWIPYLLNQVGSLVFYYTLSNSNLSLAVPCCNALALLFSVGTSYMIGEQQSVNNPLRSIVGSAFVMGGVMLCVNSKNE